MGFSKAMRSAQLMLACYLFMASASECGGDESCVAAEKDAAALLQSTVNIHGGPSGKVEDAVVAEDDSNSKRVSPRAVQLVDEVSSCTDQRDDYMAKKGHQCDNWGYMYTNRCKHGDSGWQKNKWCQQSCWDNGAGYEGDNCGATSATSEAPLESLGTSGCTTSAKCGPCQGDCDNDDDCGDGLSCFQRSGFTQVPGCAKGGRGDKKHYDYCHLVEAENQDSASSAAENQDLCSGNNNNQNGCNDADGCYWFYQTNKCSDTLPEMYVGGDPNDWGWQAKKNGGFGTVGTVKTAYRPEYKTTERFNTETNKWEPCGDANNCWYGTGSRDLRFKLSDSKYSKIAVEVNVNCAEDEKVQVAYEGDYDNDDNDWLKNADLQVWYNLEPLTLTSEPNNDLAKFARTGNLGQEGNVKGGKRFFVDAPLKKADQYPTLRVEIARKASGNAEGKAEIKIENVKNTFDKCMLKKDTHAQCLAEIGGVSDDLRSDHQKQKDCVEGNSNTDGCTKWLTCLDSDTKTIISRVAGASLQSPSTSLLQGLTIVWQNRTNPCGSGSGETCVNPTTLDIEAFDCNCFDWVKGKTQEQINHRACSDARVCCDWKEAHCPASFLQTGDEKNDRQENENAITLRNQQQKDSQEVTSLDDSVSGKRGASDDC